MKNLCLHVFLAGAAMAVASHAHAQDQASPVIGFWVTQDHESVVEILECGDRGLCGRLVGLHHDHKPGEVPKDERNSDTAKRDMPLCGLLMMGSFKPSDGTAPKWQGGWIYDPTGGSTYSSQMELDGPNTLKLRGYIGVPLFGRSETWTRETGVPNRCAVA